MKRRWKTSLICPVLYSYFFFGEAIADHVDADVQIKYAINRLRAIPEFCTAGTFEAATTHPSP
jgi:hypothetical protein